MSKMSALLPPKRQKGRPLLETARSLVYGDVGSTATGVRMSERWQHAGVCCWRKYTRLSRKFQVKVALEIVQRFIVNLVSPTVQADQLSAPGLNGGEHHLCRCRRSGRA